MKPSFPSRWLRLQTRELDAEIRKLRLSFSAAEALRDTVKAEKTRIKSANAKRRVRLHRWRDLIRQAKYEAHKVTLRMEHTRLRPDATADVRLDALGFYAEILRELTRRLEAQRDAPDAELPKSTDYRDFIPDKIKAQVHLRFDAIPRGEGKRVAEPFGDGKPRKPPPDPTTLGALLFKPAAPKPTPDPVFLFPTKPKQTQGQVVPEFHPPLKGHNLKEK